MKLFIWTEILPDKVVIAIGKTLDIVFNSWESKANGSKEGFDEIRALVNIDRDYLKKGKRRYKVNRKYWRDNPSLKIFDLPDAEEPITYQVSKGSWDTSARSK